MSVGKKLIAVGVTSATLAMSAGVAFAAEPGTTADPNAGRIAVQVATSDAKSGPDIAAIAHDLGVSVAKLDDALRATKIWLGGLKTQPTEEAFAAHLASLLHLPTAKVLKALVAHGLVIDQPGKPGGGKGAKHPVDLAKVAHDLGVSTAALQKALVQTKVWIGTSGTKPTPEAFAGHVASILGKPAALVLRVFLRDGVIVKDPGAGPGPKTTA